MTHIYAALGGDELVRCILNISCDTEWNRKIVELQCGAIMKRSIFFQLLTIDTHSSPVRARYGCLLWELTVINVLSQSLWCCIQYQVILVRLITEHDLKPEPIVVYGLSVCCSLPIHASGLRINNHLFAFNRCELQLAFLPSEIKSQWGHRPRFWKCLLIEKQETMAYI